MKKWIPLTLGLTLAMAGSAYAQTTTSTTTTKKVVALNSTTKPHNNQGNKGEGFGLKLDQSAALLTLLNTDEAKLQTQLKAGKSLVDVAAAAGVDKQKVIDLLVSQETTRLDAAQTAGSLTADQVTKKKSELTARIIKLVERQGIAEERGGHGPGEGKGHGGGWLNNSEELATLLGLTTDKLQEAVKSGKSLATIAKEQSIDVQKVIDLQVAAMTKQLDQQLADGKIEQADYTARKAQLSEQATKIVNGELVGKGGFPGGDKGHGGAFMNNSEELATLLGLTTDKLQEAVKSGKSLATIAKEQSIDVQKVIDLQVAAMTKQLDQQLADGKIEQADYTTRKAQLTEHATKIVNGELGGKGDFKGGPGGRDGGNRGNFTKPDSTTTTPTE